MLLLLWLWLLLWWWWWMFHFPFRRCSSFFLLFFFFFPPLCLFARRRLCLFVCLAETPPPFLEHHRHGGCGAETGTEGDKNYGFLAHNPTHTNTQTHISKYREIEIEIIPSFAVVCVCVVVVVVVLPLLFFFSVCLEEKEGGRRPGMRSSDVHNGRSSDVYREIPQWCLEKIPLLSREEVECIVYMYDDNTGEGEAMNERTHSTEATTTNPTAASEDTTRQDNCLQLRLAGLPMFLQTEALVLRRHEQQYRQYMKELIDLSECITMVCDGTLRHPSPNSASHVAEESPAARRKKDDALRRMFRRAEEVEVCARNAAVDRVRCAQRMLLAAAVAKHKKRSRREKAHNENEETLRACRRRR
ncbi:hypothetical protein MOQ_006256 [Trypanosoma cruzi marinkellei]|uniref:Uncharacterized protein n=1 Tax=Trypanosoma cruzi marinkellei TaxID=85056 RepID=K2N5K4_TRYCR|nr:hypothetical protein MOQ_006256 [Trypanosoma cruzi marinkellei]